MFADSNPEVNADPVHVRAQPRPRAGRTGASTDAASRRPSRSRGPCTKTRRALHAHGEERRGDHLHHPDATAPDRYAPTEGSGASCANLGGTDLIRSPRQRGRVTSGRVRSPTSPRSPAFPAFCRSTSPKAFDDRKPARPRERRARPTPRAVASSPTAGATPSSASSTSEDSTSRTRTSWIAPGRPVFSRSGTREAATATRPRDSTTAP